MQFIRTCLFLPFRAISRTIRVVCVSIGAKHKSSFRLRCWHHLALKKKNLRQIQPLSHELLRNEM